jgi:hypothetical protein
MVAEPQSPATGDVISREFWLAEVYDRWTDLYGAWESWEPFWDGSTATPTLGASTLTGSYRLLGSVCVFRLRLVLGAGFDVTSTGAWSFTLPVVPAVTQTAPGFASTLLGDVRYPVSAFLTPAGGVERMGVNNSIVGPTVPLAWDVGSQLVLTGEFEYLE